MLLKKIILVGSITVTFLNAGQSLAMPPSIPVIDMKINTDSNTTSKSTMPKECETLPPMMILLPPPMEEALVNCKNQLNFPKKELVQKQLSQFLKKEVKIEKIETVEGFNQVYKITYNGGVIFTNTSADKFLK